MSDKRNYTCSQDTVVENTSDWLEEGNQWNWLRQNLLKFGTYEDKVIILAEQP